jgi:hypothetical protein
VVLLVEAGVVLGVVGVVVVVLLVAEDMGTVVVVLDVVVVAAVVLVVVDVVVLVAVEDGGNRGADNGVVSAPAGAPGATTTARPTPMTKSAPQSVAVSRASHLLEL